VANVGDAVFKSVDGSCSVTATTVQIQLRVVGERVKVHAVSVILLLSVLVQFKS